MSFKILAINPGSTSTKVAIFNDKECVFKKNIKHQVEDLARFEKVSDQMTFRKDVIVNELKNENIDLSELDIVMGRGGLLRPITSGVYEVNDVMIRDLVNSPWYSSLHKAKEILYMLCGKLDISGDVMSGTTVKFSFPIQQ